MSDKISIIVNCFNGEKFLKQCLESINAQTYQNYEVIFWDNKSNDNSKKIFKSFENNRFKYFQSDKFTNLSEARNKALSLSTGDYIAFIDVDDIWFNTKLEEQLFFLKEKNLDITFTNFFTQKERSKKKKLKKYLNYFPKKNITENLFNNYFISISTVMYDKNKIKNIFFNQKYHLIGDYDFMMHCSLNNNMQGIDKTLAIVRYHEENETKKYFLKYIFETKMWFNLNKKKFDHFKNFKNFKSNFRYSFLKYFIINKFYRKPLMFFKYLDFKKKIKIILFYIINLKIFKIFQ